MWFIEPRNRDRGDLADASFVSASESWAAGDSGSAEHSKKTLIERFDETACTTCAFASAFSGTAAVLEDFGS
jgi:hypothetical protein